MGGVFERDLASGALRLIEINGKPQELSKLGNKEEKIKGTLKSGYFGIIKPGSNELFIDAEIEGLLIRRDEVPESYFELQRRIARERGYGDFELTDRQKEEDTKRLREDQKESLMRWSGYLRSKENGHSYPDWFKVYVWESLKKMGEFDEEGGKFKKRTKSTVAPWPELNAEALSYVYDNVSKGVIQGEDIEDKQMVELLNRGNFAAMYAYAIYSTEVGGLTPELREITDGSWVKYNRIKGNYRPNYSYRRTQKGYEATDKSLTVPCGSLNRYREKAQGCVRLARILRRISYQKEAFMSITRGMTTVTIQCRALRFAWKAIRLPKFAVLHPGKT